jgi:hypothetical protein
MCAVFGIDVITEAQIRQDMAATEPRYDKDGKLQPPLPPARYLH